MFKGMLLLKVDEKTIKNARWFLLIGEKFFKIVPLRTLFGVFMTLTSKLTNIVASYLPVKVLILLGGTGVPKYFPSNFKQFDHTELVIGLCAATVGFYLIHIVAEKILDRINSGGGNIILESTKKMQLFERQPMIAQKGFERYSKVLAEVFFLVVTVSVLLWLYPMIVLIMTVYIFFVVSVIKFFFDSSVSTSNDKDGHLKTLVGVVSHVGLLIVFVFMIYQALNDEGPGILVMFLTFLFIRRSQGSINQLIVNTSGLLREQLEINALFFEEHRLVQKKQSHEDLFWSLAERDQLEKWSGSIIEKFIGEPAEIIKYCWIELDIKNVLAYRVLAKNESGTATEYLIKLFGKKQTLAAQHETEVMLKTENLPSQKLLVADDVQGFHCLLYAWEDGRTPADDEKKCWIVFNQALMKVDLAKLFLEKYLRSHPILPQRLDVFFWEHVECVLGSVTKNASSSVMPLLAIREEINKRLNSLPLVIVNLELSRRELLETQQGVLSLSWGQWAMEPIGTGWLIEKEVFNVLYETAQKIDRLNNGYVSLKISDIRLAAYMQLFEGLVKTQKFYQALKLIPAIIENVEQEDGAGEKVGL